MAADDLTAPPISLCYQWHERSAGWYEARAGRFELRVHAATPHKTASWSWYARLPPRESVYTLVAGGPAPSRLQAKAMAEGSCDALGEILKLLQWSTPRLEAPTDRQLPLQPTTKENEK